jgi:hypothetical protein
VAYIVRRPIVVAKKFVVDVDSNPERVKGVAKQIEGKLQKGVGYVEQALDKRHRKIR